MGYQLRDEPMTVKEIKAEAVTGFTDDIYPIEEVIPMGINELVGWSWEVVFDTFEYKILGEQAMLQDINYDVVGTGLGDVVHIKVMGFAVFPE